MGNYHCRVRWNLTHCQFLFLLISFHNFFNQLTVMPHDVIEGVPQGEEKSRLNMKLLRVATLLNEIDVFQSDRAQVHINTPFACHSLQREVPQVILKRQAVLRAELDQCVRCLTIALFVGDGNREDNILFGAGLTMPAGRVAGMDGILIARETFELIKAGNLRAVPAVESAISFTCPECQSRLRQSHSSLSLRFRHITLFEGSLTLFLSPAESAQSTALFLLDPLSQPSVASGFYW